MAPVKKAVKRAVRRTSPVEPQNQSRGAGAAAPASAAATQPRSGFYNPDSLLAASPLRQATEIHVERVQAEAVQQEEHQPSVDGPLAAELHAVLVEPPAGETLEEAIQRIRLIRKPLGAYQQKLALDKRPGYHTHWFNDEGGRIDDALANGWAFRKDKDGKPTKRAVGRGRDQGVLYAYGMDIPEVFWQADMDARHAAAAEKIDGLKAAPFRAPNGKADKADKGRFYDPVEDSPSGPLSIAKG